MKKLRTNKPGFQERLPLLLAFLLPIIVMFGICAGNGIYPFGTQSFLRTDLYHQYAPFYSNLGERLKSGSSLTYAFDIGLGTNYSAIIGYYLFCPTQLLLYLIPDSFIIEFITIMILLKIGLAGYAFAKYLSIKHKTLNMGITFFALCYALSGYMAAYSWNIMWLDCIILAPFVMLGLEKLVYEHKPWMYLWTLALSIMSNYYISIMICIFSVLYFIGLMIMKPGRGPVDVLKEMGLFALYSLLAGGISAVIFLPAVLELMTTYASTSASSGAVTGSLWESVVNLFGSLPNTLEQYFTIVDMSARSLVNVSCEVGLDHWPNLYSGVATLVFLPMYYMNRRVNYKEKIVKTVLLVIFLASFSLNIPNYIWHGMRLPNSLPCRQSFLYTILLLSMCFEGYKGFKGLSRSKLVGILFGVSGFIVALQFFVGETDDIQNYVYYLSLAFVGLYCLCLYLYKCGKARAFTAYAIMLAVLIVELAVNTAVTSVHTSNRSYYIGNKFEYQELLENTNDDSFYRVERSKLLTNNDGPWTGYNSVSLFSSTTPDALRTFYKKLGMKASVNAYAHTGATPLIDSLLSVKYILSSEILAESDLYTFIDSEGEAYLYQNNYTLPLGYAVPSDLNDLWSYSSSNAIKAQNSLVNLLGIEGDELLSSIPGSSSGKSYTTTVNTRSRIFVNIESSSVTSVRATIGETTKTFSDLKHKYLLDLGYCEAGSEIRLSTDDDVTTLQATAYVFNEEVFIKTYEALSKQALENLNVVNTLSETSITGSITVKKDQSLLISIPYDKGWTIKVDGVITEAQSLSGALIMIPLTEGTHFIEMSYTPDGFKTGLAITLISLGVLIFCIAAALLIRKFKKNNGPEDPNLEDLLDLPEDEDEVLEPAPEIDHVPTLDEAMEAATPGDEPEPEPKPEPAAASAPLPVKKPEAPKTPENKPEPAVKPEATVAPVSKPEPAPAPEKKPEVIDIPDSILELDDNKEPAVPVRKVAPRLQNLQVLDLKEDGAKEPAQSSEAPASHQATKSHDSFTVVNLHELSDDEISETVDLSYILKK